MDEKERLRVLADYRIMDTLPEKEFDEIVELASLVCQTPICLITFLDSKRQWYKAKINFDQEETPREQAFCLHAIKNPNRTLLVPDTHEDPQFRENRLVLGYPYIRFYAGAPITTQDGVPLGTLCVIDQTPRELTASQLRALGILANRVMVQMELRKHNLDQQVQLDAVTAQLQAITNQSPDIILTLDKNFRITYINRTHSSVGADSPLGQSLIPYIPLEYKESYLRIVQEVLDTGKPDQISFPMVMRDGKRDWFLSRFSPLRNKQGHIEQVLVMASNITDWKALEVQNKLNQERLMEAQETARLGFWDWNLETGELYWSPELYALFGRKIGDSPASFAIWQEQIHPEDREQVRQAIIQGLKNEDRTTVEYRITRPDGKQLWLYGRGRASVDANGKVIRLHGFAQDITERKEAEEHRLAYAQSLEEMLFITSHQLRKPISNCLGLIQLLDSKACNEEELDRALSYLSSSVRELDGLTREMTEFLFNHRFALDPKSAQE